MTEHLKQRLGWTCTRKTVRRALGRIRYSWKRPRRVMLNDPGYERRMAKIEEALDAAGPEATVLFEDETEFQRFPPMRKACHTADRIILTSNEVLHAQDERNECALFILHNIKIENGKIASGGEKKVVHPWSPVQDRLFPISYQYELT